uniref:cytochrome P450 2C15-like isoform X1 n=1 Tax=Ciona intestinalis TaxID=7719 RepID=UPI000180BBF9|nr:cytochrome P450 2C15-like isoform X1 [Ciona intestinalis]|eukprot:XP_009858723.2 cytochrome P450 2C15-like isoform X1 [Ciona intestinalis]
MIEAFLRQWTDTTTVIIFLVTLLFYYWYRRPLRFPPGPRGLPLVGVLPFLGKYTARTMHKWSKKYGPVMSVRMGNEDWVVMGNYEAVHQSFVKAGNVFSGRPVLKVANEIAEGKGIVMRDFNTTWKTHRKFGSITLRGFGVGKKSLEDRIYEEVEVMNKEILSKGGKPFDITEILTNAVMNVISIITTDQRFEYDDEHFRLLQQIFTKWFLEPENTAAFANIIYVPLLCNIPPYRSKYLEVKRDMKRVSAVFQQMVEQHRKTFDKNNLRDFIDAFICEGKKGTDESFTDGQLVQYVREMFEAGTETMTGTVRWAMLCLIHYPDGQKKLREEIFEAIGNNNRPSISDRKAMPFTSAFIQEVFRFRTRVPLGVQHMTTQTVNFANYVIPKGTTILANMWAVHNDPDVWDEPSKFKPERHLDDKGNFVQSNHVIPFSVGPRHCLGEQLARMEIFIFLVSMVQKFEFLPDPNEPDLPEIDDGVKGNGFFPYPFNFVASEI